MGQESGSMRPYSPADFEAETIDDYDTGAPNPSPVVVGPSGVGPQSLGDADLVDVPDVSASTQENIYEDTRSTGTTMVDTLADDDSVAAEIASREDAQDDTEDEDPEEIRSQIEQTRADMSQTIDAIQAKLSPDNLKQQAQEVVREATVGRAQEAVTNVTETAKGFGENMLETIKENPLPAALAAIGIGWLLTKNSSKPNRQQSRYYDNYPYGPDYLGYRPTYREQYARPYEGRYAGPDGGNYSRGYNNQGGGVGEMASQARDKVGDVAQSAGDTVGQVASKAGDAVGNVADTAGTVVNRAGQAAGSAADLVGDRAEDATDWFQRSLRENPLTVGAIAVAVGAALGLMLPETQKEHEIMGPARDNLMDKAQGAVQQTMDKVQRVASEVADTAQQEAQNQGLTGQGNQNNSQTSWQTSQSGTV